LMPNGRDSSPRWSRIAFAAALRPIEGRAQVARSLVPGDASQIQL